MTTSKSIASNTSFKKSFALSSTVPFTAALIMAGFAPIPRNPFDPSSTTSIINLSLDTVKY